MSETVADPGSESRIHSEHLLPVRLTFELLVVFIGVYTAFLFCRNNTKRGERRQNAATSYRMRSFARS